MDFAAEQRQFLAKHSAQVKAATLRVVAEWLDDYDIGTNPEGDSVIFSIPLAAYEVMFGAALRAGQESMHGRSRRE